MSAQLLLPRFLGVKDPDDRVKLTFKGRVPLGVTVTSATVTEVDESDTPVAQSAFTFGAVLLTAIDATYWVATCSADGGFANPVVTPGVLPDPKRYLLRSRWFLSNGTQRDKIVRLYVANT